MSDLSPTGPAQPTQQQAYETAGNPATSEPAEAAAAKQGSEAAADAPKTDQRVPSQQTSSVDEATPNAMGRGIRGAGPGEEAEGKTHEDMGRHKELDGQQMAMPGEGRVADAVEEKKGASGKQEDFVSDLDRKKAEQAPAREAMKAQRKEEVDVGGILGQRGGPANPVDKNNYPNSGD
ncbi:hypothetical protein H2201_000649 [Coniosporium apollinis]|uniref:SMP domain-containing protein n=1 Tax=Coniosporium apollinis TaxID=61459 RepID=A0ABQ9P4J2_9PEZI|nr:hypothetical protein H2201_000649 [Coniosporium apollinis]